MNKKIYTFVIEYLRGGGVMIQVCDVDFEKSKIHLENFKFTDENGNVYYPYKGKTYLNISEFELSAEESAKINSGIVSVWNFI
jgi:hypothetical protein